MNNISNPKYWNKFYKKINLTNKPSKFAKFCKNKIRNYKGILYDMGCGNGRDTIYLNLNKIKCIGLDKSREAIKKNKQKFVKYKNFFKKKNFCNFFLNKIENKKFSVYSRFTIHSINYVEEKKLLKGLEKQKNLEFVFIETRTTKDELFGVGKKIGKNEYIDTHYRRFIEPQVLKKQLSKKFKIIYYKQAKNLAKYKKENPCVLRIIAKKK